eukprot:CAMPEP_0197432322 /NCGR_PEP_ID=MMETSP1175-20131217/403_1 /TAXON_ID=1003142 /ORGANISM="Triceratium dubium, Strain CCMP147" /LENGTH=42 /DNA_ID= /DNA_START= /DNA_END= /DNA_ORIENTATION=
MALVDKAEAKVQATPFVIGQDFSPSERNQQHVVGVQKNNGIY